MNATSFKWVVAGIIIVTLGALNHAWIEGFSHLGNISQIAMNQFLLFTDIIVILVLVSVFRWGCKTTKDFSLLNLGIISGSIFFSGLMGQFQHPITIGLTYPYLFQITFISF